MGATLKSAESLGQTTQLVDWITKVRFKKTNVKKQRRKNLLVEAVLSHALIQAETELRRKQQQRLQRWHQVKNHFNQIESRWGSCEDINSLDNFMSQLSKVKAPIER